MGFRKTTNDQREMEARTRDKKGVSYINFNLDIFHPKDGDNAIRIVPPLEEDRHAQIWGLEIRNYFLGGKVVLSSSILDQNKPDPVKSLFFKVKEQQGYEAAKVYNGIRRYLMYVIDANDDFKLKLWPAPISVMTELSSMSRDRATGQLLPLESPTEGRIIYFTKSGEGLTTKYNRFQVGDVYPIDDSMCNSMATFESILVIPTPEELSSLLNSTSSDDYPEQEEPVSQGNGDWDSLPGNTPAVVQAPHAAVAHHPSTPTQPPSTPAGGASESMADLKAKIAARLAKAG